MQVHISSKGETVVISEIIIISTNIPVLYFLTSSLLSNTQKKKNLHLLRSDCPFCCYTIKVLKQTLKFVFLRLLSRCCRHSCPLGRARPLTAGCALLRRRVETHDCFQPGSRDGWRAWSQATSRSACTCFKLPQSRTVHIRLIGDPKLRVCERNVLSGRPFPGWIPRL